MLLRLDLRLERAQLVQIGALLVTTPLVTTCGMLLYQDMNDDPGEPPTWKRVLMGLCAFAAHALHTIVAYLALCASWPDPAFDGDALLPGKFRSTLYLDVFGWLLNPNPTGPAPAAQATTPDAAPSGARVEPLPPSAAAAAPGAAVEPLPFSAAAATPSGAAQPGPHAPTAQTAQPAGPAARGAAWEARPRSFGLSEDIQQEARRLLHPEGAPSALRPGARTSAASTPSASPRPSPRVTERWGGHEAVPLEVMQRVSAPSAENATTFTQMPPQRVSRKVRGEPLV